MYMCIGGENDGTLISYLEPTIILPLCESLNEIMCSDYTSPQSPVALQVENYRLETFSNNFGERKYFYIISYLSNEDVLEEVRQRWEKI